MNLQSSRGAQVALVAAALHFCAVPSQAMALDATAAPGARLGLAAGRGTQRLLSGAPRDYQHEVRTLRLLLGFPLWRRGPLGVELAVEPTYAADRHRLLNPYYVKPSEGRDYLAQRERFTSGETVHEYALQLGLVARYDPTPAWSLSAFACTGPLYGDAATERLARGLAFSDVFGVGVGARAGALLVELRPSWRHVSNANTQRPNSGHDSANLELAVSLTR